MAGAIHREEQVDAAIDFLTLAICLIEALIAVVSRAPNFVFYAAMNIIFRIGLNDEESVGERRNILLAI